MFEATSTRFIKAAFVVLFLGAALFVVTMNLFDPARAERMAMLEHDHARMTRLIEREARETERLERELEALQTGLEGWHETARREDGMILDGEVIFHFPRERE
ncbi:MAG: hypothetical protein EP329_22290 [Deltaproteobacteria bacterium]|nr:MAG: hypothetical protein EP329_22290 [Deltaproteobacteria bacterium]